MEHTPTPWAICYDGQIDGSNGVRVISLPFSSYKEFNDNEKLKTDTRFIVRACNDYDRLHAKITELEGIIAKMEVS